VREYLEQVTTSFTELSFMPLDDVWETGLKDVFNDVQQLGLVLRTRLDDLSSSIPANQSIAV